MGTRSQRKIAIGFILTLVFAIPATRLAVAQSTTDSFVLFAEESLLLNKDTQVSSGDIGSNNTLDLQKDIVVNGNVLANTVTIDKNTVINGNVSFNKLRAKKDVQILQIE